MDTVVDSKAVNDCLDKIRPYIQHDGGDMNSMLSMYLLKVHVKDV